MGEGATWIGVDDGSGLDDVELAAGALVEVTVGEGARGPSGMVGIAGRLAFGVRVIGLGVRVVVMGFGVGVVVVEDDVGRGLDPAEVELGTAAAAGVGEPASGSGTTVALVAGPVGCNSGDLPEAGVEVAVAIWSVGVADGGAGVGEGGRDGGRWVALCSGARPVAAGSGP